MLQPLKKKWKILVGIVCLLFVLNLIADIWVLTNWKDLPVRSEINLNIHSNKYGIATCIEPDEYTVLQPTKSISFCEPMKHEPIFSNVLPDIPSWGSTGVQPRFTVHGHSCKNIVSNMMINNTYIYFNHKSIHNNDKSSPHEQYKLLSNYEKCINIACKDCPNSCYNDWRKILRVRSSPTEEAIWFARKHSINLQDWYFSDSLIRCDDIQQWGNKRRDPRGKKAFWFLIMITKEILKLFICCVYYCNIKLLNEGRGVKFLPLIINTPILFISDLFCYENYSYSYAGRKNNNNNNIKHEFPLHCLLYFENHTSKREHFLRIFNVLIDLCLQHIPSFVFVLQYLELVDARLIFIQFNWVLVSIITGVLCMLVHGLILVNSLLLMFFVTKKKATDIDLLIIDNDDNGYELKEMSAKHSLLHKNKNKNKNKNHSNYVTFQKIAL